MFDLVNQVIGCKVPACMLLVMESASLLFIVSIAIDKALSLARPLHYSNIVTFFSVNVYIVTILAASLLIGAVLPLSVFDGQSIDNPEVR